MSILHILINAMPIKNPNHELLGFQHNYKINLEGGIIWTKKGSHTKPDKLKGGLHGGLTNSETESNHVGWSEHLWWAVTS